MCTVNIFVCVEVPRDRGRMYSWKWVCVHMHSPSVSVKVGLYRVSVLGLRCQRPRRDIEEVKVRDRTPGIWGIENS